MHILFSKLKLNCFKRISCLRVNAVFTNRIPALSPIAHSAYTIITFHLLPTKNESMIFCEKITLTNGCAADKRFITTSTITSIGAIENRL